MTEDPQPMDPERLTMLTQGIDEIDRYDATIEDIPPGLQATAAKMLAVGLAELARELLADRDWHRAQVEVTDDHIRATGLDEDDPRFDTWLATQDEIHRVPSEDDGYCDGYWSADPVVYRMAVFLNYVEPSTVNAAARAVGRGPLDVLAEIAATEV